MRITGKLYLSFFLRTHAVWKGISVLILLALFAGTVEAQPPEVRQHLDLLLNGLRNQAAKKGMASGTVSLEPARVMFGRDGYVRHLGAPPGNAFQVLQKTPDDSAATAKEFLRENARIFTAPSKMLDYRLMRSKTKNKRTYNRFVQTFAEIEVFAGQTIVQLNEEGDVEYVVSDVIRDPRVLENEKISISPTFSSEEVRSIVADMFVGQYPNLTITTTVPLLMIFAPELIGSEGEPRLVWQLEVAAHESLTPAFKILFDAHYGSIVRQFPLNLAALNREVFDASNSNDDPGKLERSEGEGASGIADADDAYDFLGDTYDFYKTHHDRDSINDGGLTLSSTVRFCSDDPDICSSCPCTNAFWSGSRERFYFGDGYAVDDVVAHEYTHGVTRFESDLVYENQSGAINESFSDIWGEFVDLTNGEGTDTTATRWQLGEDLGTPIRDMSDPTLYDDPDRMNSSLYHTGSSDYGGVHTNCGVGNKLAYLLTDGDTFNGHTVYGIGIDRIAELYYEVQVNILTSGADYRDLFHALQQAAVNLSWNSTDRDNLSSACLAVEIVNTIYVDKDAIIYQDGSSTFPFDTVEKGHSAIKPGDHIKIRSGTYPENIRLDKISTIKIWGTEPVTIGE